MRYAKTDPSNLYYAGVGSRETPQSVMERMTKCSRVLARRGYTLRSEGAPGADTAFEKGAGGAKEIFHPNDPLPLWTNIFTDHFHPAPDRLTGYVRKLMNRNALQILGRDCATYGSTPVKFVVCWTKDGKNTGGTGQALRIADYFHIPVFNFYRESDIEKLKQFTKGIQHE